LSKTRLGILGASGFVGSALVDRLFFDPEYRDRYDVTAFIHSFGNAARLSRLPIKVQALDLLDYDNVLSTLVGCDCIVNCTRGDSLLMLNGHKNLLRALKKVGTRKFIHLSSVAIFGDNPLPESQSEDAAPHPKRNAYGEIKATQDEWVLKLNEQGVPSIILCPSNIGGPYSSLIVDAVRKVAAREIVLVDDGRFATNIVHVDNLVQSILTAVESDTGWGERYFANEAEPVTWKQFYTDLAAMVGVDADFPVVSREEIVRHMEGKQTGPSQGVKSQIGTMVSRDFRDAIGIVPAIKKMDDAAMGLFNRMNPGLKEKLRGKLRKPITINEARASQHMDHKLVTAQIRRFYHSPEKIINRLGYKPLFNYEEGMRTTQKWLEFCNIIPSGNSIHHR